MARSLAVAALASVLAVSSVAHASHPEDDWDGVAVGVPIILAVELTPLVLGTIDLVSTPTSKTYGGVEVVAGGLAFAMNTFAFVDMATNCPDCTTVMPVVGVLALIDAAVAAHGIYVLTRDKPATEITIGRASGRIAPTVVGDGKAHAAGLGIIGRF